MPIPEIQSLFLPVLRFMADGADYSVTELRKHTAKCLKLTRADLAQKLPNGVQTVFVNRVAWSLSHLSRTGAIQKIAPGMYRITECGERLLQEHPEITIQILNEFPEFVTRHGPLELPEGAKVGSIVRVTWPVSEADKVYAGTYEGRILRIDDGKIIVLFEYELGSDPAREQVTIDLKIGLDYKYHAVVSEIDLLKE